MTETAMQRTPAQKFWAKVRKGTGDDCWVWTGQKSGNGRARCYHDGRTQSASRVVLALVGVPPPDDKQVCHRCDNGLCVNPAHLFLGTRSDNMVDMVKKGRAAHDKLSPADVTAIRASYRFGVSGCGYGALSRHYRVHKKTIIEIVKGHIFKWLPTHPTGTVVDEPAEPIAEEEPSCATSGNAGQGAAGTRAADGGAPLPPPEKES